MHRPSLVDVQNSLCQLPEPPVSIHKTPCVNSQKPPGQSTEPSLSVHRDPPDPPPLSMHKSPLSLPRAPLFIVQNPPPYQCTILQPTLQVCRNRSNFSWQAGAAIRSPTASLCGLCLVLLVTKSHNQYAPTAFCHRKCCQRQQSGPTVALWQASMASALLLLVTSPHTHNRYASTAFCHHSFRQRQQPC